MVPDPYLALGLPHGASQVQIKRAYRRLAMRCHPDRLQRINASQEEMQEATSKFAECAQAYALLSDPRRKREYDHIYKFGGYDDLPEKTVRHSPPPRCGANGAVHASSPSKSSSTNNVNSSSSSSSSKRPVSQMGIGYTIIDPFTYIMSQGKIRSKAVAGVTIPSRFNMAHSPSGGFRLSFSSGMLQETPSGTIEYTSKTTQFADGKKFSKIETTTLHNDGRKEVIIEGDDYVERRISKAPKRKRRCSSKDKDDLTNHHHTGSDHEPAWYMSAWNGLRDNLAMCTNPCTGTISVR